MSSKHATKQSSKVASNTFRTTKPSGATTTQPPPFFPFAQYTSIVGVHSSLLAFTALFLPRTSLALLLEYSPFFTNESSDASMTATPHLPTLSENPLRTAVWLCVGTFILQVWWASYIRGWSLKTRDLSGGVVHDAAERTEQKMQRQTWNKGRLAAFGSACLCTAVASFAFAIIALLFGAPLYSHFFHTYLLSLIVSLLTVFAPAYTLGTPSPKSDVVALVTRLTWIRLFAELSPRSPVERAVVYPAVGAILGCWSGAIPAGLDWEEPWQRWPLTTAYGAIGGFVLGSLWALCLSATENLASLGRQAQVSPSSEATRQPQGKTSKKAKSD